MSGSSKHLYSICPGRHLAEASVWIALVNFLSVFEISPAQDERGNAINPEVKFTFGITRCVKLIETYVRRAEPFASRPCPFKCKIIPRSQRSRELIESLS